MMLTYFATICTFMISATGFAVQRKHLVSALLCIEGMMLALFMSLALLPQTLNLTTTTVQPIVLLALTACETSAGLALLVATTRAHATDHMKNLDLLKC